MELGGGSGGASNLLEHLPSLGNFTGAVHTSTPGGLRTYVCEHETAPPAEQLIKTDTTNILIRSLTLKKDHQQKGKDATKADALGKGKRPAERPADDKLPPKKPNLGTGKKVDSRELQSLTVGKLRSMLKEKGLPVRGKKEELIARLKTT